MNPAEIALKSINSNRACLKKATYISTISSIRRQWVSVNIRLFTDRKSAKVSIEVNFGEACLRSN